MKGAYFIILLSIIKYSHQKNDVDQEQSHKFNQMSQSDSKDIKSMLRSYDRVMSYSDEQLIDEELKKHGLSHKDAAELAGIEKEKPTGFISPKDEIMYRKETERKTHKLTGVSRRMNGTRPKLYFDFDKILERNLVRPYPKKNNKNNKKEDDSQNTNNFSDKTKLQEFFDKESFAINDNGKRKVNWTSCDEFARRALFHPNDIVNIDWLPFYSWSDRGLSMAPIYRFSYPTKKVVQHYMTEYGPYVRDIDWKQPKLLLNEYIEMLMVAGDRKGLFYGITKHEVPDSIKENNSTYPLLILRMKIVDPYLALMFCEEHYAVIMAVEDTAPQIEEEMEKEAAILKFRGVGHPIFRSIPHELREKKMLRQKKLHDESRKFLAVHKSVVDLSTLV